MRLFLESSETYSLYEAEATILAELFPELSACAAEDMNGELRVGQRSSNHGPGPAYSDLFEDAS